MQQRFINEAHRRFVVMLKTDSKAKACEERRKESAPERRRRLEQIRHDRIAARRK